MSRETRVPRPPCTVEWAVGEAAFYVLNPFNHYLRVVVASITSKRVVVVPVDESGARTSGNHRSVLPRSLVRAVPAGGRIW